MEPRSKSISGWIERKPPLSSIEEYYSHAQEMVKDVYLKTLEHYQFLTPSKITPDTFIQEYIWVVYVSGFSSKVLADKYDDLLKCYQNIFFSAISGDIRKYFDDVLWPYTSRIISNRVKHNAVRDAILILNEYFKLGETNWFEQFKKDYLSSPDAMENLPFIGPVTKYHLARNLGLDAVKPDRHLVRLAKHFGFEDPFSMCTYLSALHEERIGVVDLILFYAGSTWGTSDLPENEGEM